MGLDNFLVIGDVYRLVANAIPQNLSSIKAFYRRDEIDSSHYPAFHQAEGVRLMNEEEVSDLWKKRQRKANSKLRSRDMESIRVFDESSERNDYKQASHTLDVTKFLELDLKECLVDLSKELFGNG